MPEPKNEAAQKWFSGLSAPPKQPELIPEIGVRIECRMIVREQSDWDLVRDLLREATAHGAAEIVEYITF